MGNCIYSVLEVALNSAITDTGEKIYSDYVGLSGGHWPEGRNLTVELFKLEEIGYNNYEDKTPCDISDLTRYLVNKWEKQDFLRANYLPFKEFKGISNKYNERVRKDCGEEEGYRVVFWETL